MPKWACVAFAARCALRVQPLYDLPPDHPDRKKNLQAVDLAVRLAAAGSASLTARSATDAADAANACSADAGYASAYAAAAAAAAASTACPADPAYDAADAAFDAADAAFDAAVDLVPSIRVDFGRVHTLVGQVPSLFNQPIDATEAGPLGPLWPEGMPIWYVEKKAWLDVELARLEGAGTAKKVNPLFEEHTTELPLLSDACPERLVLRVTVGEFAPIDEVADELVNLYRALNEAHIAGGGQGLIVDDWELFIGQGVPVTGGCV